MDAIEFGLISYSAILIPLIIMAGIQLYREHKKRKAKMKMICDIFVKEGIENLLR